MTPRPSRLSAWTAALAVAAAVPVWVWLGTNATGSLLGTEQWSELYDSLAKGLVRLEADVDPSVIDWEGFTIGDKKYTYVGPLPALPRIVTNALWPERIGQWARVSGFLAALVALAGVVVFSRRALARNPSAPSPGAAAVLAAGVAAGFALGSPLLLLVASGKIYHEAILWGFAAAAWGVGYAFELAFALGEAARRRALLGLSVAAGAALLARLTFGLPLYLLVAWHGLVELRRAFRSKGGSAAGTLLALSPAFFGGAVQLWYDWARFRNPFKVFEWNGYYVDVAALHGVFNGWRLPDALRALVLPSPRFFAGSFPWIRMELPELARPEVFFGWREPTLPLSMGSPWLLAAAIAGAIVWIRRRRATALPGAIAFGIQSALILSFYFLTQRYAAEILPLLFFLTLGALAEAPLSGRGTGLRIGLMSALVALSTAITFAATFHWNVALNLDSPFPYRLRFAPLFERELPAGPPGRRVPLGSILAETHSFAPPMKGGTFEGEPIVIAGVPYADGLGMHAVSTATFAVPQGAESFEAAVGLAFRAISCGAKASAVFEVRDPEGRVLATSPVRRAGEPAVVMRARVAGLSRVVLAVGDAGDGVDCDHACWVKAAFVVPSGAGPTP